MAEIRRNWTEREIERAIDLYVRTPFGRLHSRNPDIIDLAGQLGRTAGSVALKLTNLASIDETLDRKGMANASNLDRTVWNRFFSELMSAGESLELASLSMKNQGFADEAQVEFSSNRSEGTIATRLTNVRLGQDFFRRMVLASYDLRCAITGISQTELLVAGHIRPWASDRENRLNPRNGICLNRLHDKAFEEKLITIEDDGRVIYSKRLKPDAKDKLLRLNDSGLFKFPSRFKPDPEFLSEHRDSFRLQDARS